MLCVKRQPYSNSFAVGNFQLSFHSGFSDNDEFTHSLDFCLANRNLCVCARCPVPIAIRSRPHTRRSQTSNNERLLSFEAVAHAFFVYSILLISRKHNIIQMVWGCWASLVSLLLTGEWNEKTTIPSTQSHHNLRLFRPNRATMMSINNRVGRKQTNAWTRCFSSNRFSSRIENRLLIGIPIDIGRACVRASNACETSRLQIKRNNSFDIKITFSFDGPTREKFFRRTTKWPSRTRAYLVEIDSMRMHSWDVSGRHRNFVLIFFFGCSPLCFGFSELALNVAAAVAKRWR